MPARSSPAQNRADRGWWALRRPKTRRMAVLVGGAAALAGAICGVTATGLASGTSSSSSGTRHGHAASAWPVAGNSGRAVGRHAAARSSAARSSAARSSAARSSAARSSAASSPTPRTATAGGQATASGATVAANARSTRARPGQVPLRTSCRSVAHIGDSTSVDLISPDSIPNANLRLGARYAAVGVRHVKIDASGGRSIVEELPGQINGYQVASIWRDRGYRGCWVFALGTNDSANVAAGSSVGMMARIDQMMQVAHGEPVLWVNARTLLSSGPWANANEQKWDQALVRALAKYPNMRIFDWSAVARPNWFLSDGIHYNSAGCVLRAKAIADGLARAFPRNGRSAAKIVR